MTTIEEVYRLYFKDVYRYLLRLSSNQQIAEEITAETFMKVLKYYDSYKGKAHIKSWIISIARNTYINQMKKLQREVLKDDLDLLGQSVSFERELFLKFEVEEIYETLKILPETSRKVFSMRVFDELSFIEIAEEFSKSPNWACVTYYRAKEKIKKEVESNEK